MTLQLVDRFITGPFGVVEDVLVKVHHFTFPVDFVLMDIEEDEEIPLILGQPFMLTTKCVDDKKVTFYLFEATRKDHFPFPFMDQMLEWLAGQSFYYFLPTEGSHGLGEDDFYMPFWCLCLQKDVIWVM